MTIEIETAIVTASTARETMAVATVKTTIALTGNRARAVREGCSTTKNSGTPARAGGEDNTAQAERCIAAAAITSQAIGAPMSTVMSATALMAAPAVAATAAAVTVAKEAEAAAVMAAPTMVTSRAAATAPDTNVAKDVTATGRACRAAVTHKAPAIQAVTARVKDTARADEVTATTARAGTAKDADTVRVVVAMVVATK